ncbi:MAG TPA: alpha/beta fold hydrolase [Isosphaeraceae bacterium]|nr:alpha/beta fold hydrolase [Isosphaeraceae bacterium]
MIGLPNSVPTVAWVALLATLLALVLLLRLTIKYAPIIGQKFEERPFFAPLRVSPVETGQLVEFSTPDGLRLSGSYLRARTPERAGVFVYCHEYLSDRWSFHPYVDPLRDLGFDIFAFDFRNHGASGYEAGYSPMHWASDREVCDLRAALAYLRSRPDRDPAGFGLFGVSRGGTTALLVTPGERDVWGVITDGAFPTTGMMVSYSVRWTELFIKSPLLRGLLPRWLYTLLARVGRRRAERRLNCRFPEVERAVARLAPRPWLMIHGQRDTYVSPDVVQDLFRHGNGPKELWLVPAAKHNRCRECEPEAYAARLVGFLQRFAPRRPVVAPAPAPPPLAETRAELTGNYTAELEAPKLAGEVLQPAEIQLG